MVLYDQPRRAGRGLYQLSLAAHPQRGRVGGPRRRPPPRGANPWGDVWWRGDPPRHLLFLAAAPTDRLFGPDRGGIPGAQLRLLRVVHRRPGDAAVRAPVFVGSYAYVFALERNGRSVAAPLAFALAALTRPEGVLLFGVASVHLVWTEVRSRGRVFTSRLVLWALLFAVLYVPYYVWRCTYYGYPFPNTFYAKVGGGLHQYVRGIHYLLAYLRWNGVLVLRCRSCCWSNDGGHACSTFSSSKPRPTWRTSYTSAATGWRSFDSSRALRH